MNQCSRSANASWGILKVCFVCFVKSTFSQNASKTGKFAEAGTEPRFHLCVGFIFIFIYCKSRPSCHEGVERRMSWMYVNVSRHGGFYGDRFQNMENFIVHLVCKIRRPFSLSIKFRVYNLVKKQK